MFSNISTLGWVVIIGLAVFIVTLNLGLFLGVKQHMEKGNWIDKLSAAGQVMKDPLKKENELYQKLSDQVAQLKSVENNTDNHEQFIRGKEKNE
jgi:hypothetical protein